MLRIIESALTAVMRKLHAPPKSNYAATAAAIAAPQYQIDIVAIEGHIDITATLPNAMEPTYILTTVSVNSLKGTDHVAVFSADRWAIVFKIVTNAIPKHEHQLVFFAIKSKLASVLDSKKLGLLAVGELAEAATGSKLKFTGDVNKTVMLVRLSPYN